MPTDLPTTLSAPAMRALNLAGITTVEESRRYTDAELLSLHGFGPKGLRLLNEARRD